MTTTTQSGVSRLNTVGFLSDAQLNRSILVAKKVIDITHGTKDAYQDNEEDEMKSDAHVLLQEIVPDIPVLEWWQYVDVVKIFQAKKFQAAVSMVTARCQHTCGTKTKVCVYFLTGGCHNTSEECKFAHTQAELAPDHQRAWELFRTEMCTDPQCKRGGKCIFAHRRNQLREPERTVAVASDGLSLNWPAFELDFPTVSVEALQAAKRCVPHAATDLLCAVQALLFFRNATAHMRGSSVYAKKGITVTTYDFMVQVITVAGRCIAAALDTEAVKAFEKSMAELLSDHKLLATQSALTATSATFTPAAAALTVPPAAESKCKDWSVEQVQAFFEECKFPTQGVVDGLVDGKTLELLCAQEDAQAIFCAPVPDGFGFGRLLYVGRFKTEMAALNVSFKKK